MSTEDLGGALDDVHGRSVDGMAWIWAMLEQDRLKWRGVQMEQDILQAVAKVRAKVSSPKIDLSHWTFTGKRHIMPLDSGFKWVAPSLNSYQLLGRDMSNLFALTGSRPYRLRTQSGRKVSSATRTRSPSRSPRSGRIRRSG